MYEFFDNAGIFAWPLLLCSVLAVFIIVERLVALRSSRVIPAKYRDSFLSGQIPSEGDDGSVAGRVLQFYYDAKADAEQLKAYSRLELSRLERGLFVLEVIISAAPLLGLLGTVTGLVRVFSQISPDTGLPDTEAFVEGVALALSTTMFGLAIAIPTLAFNSWIGRRLEAFAAQLEVGVERLVALKQAHRRRS
jgi:biopolymer transport protein ExbB